MKRLSLEGKVDLILKTVVTMGEEVREIKETMATKDYVDQKTGEVIREVRAISKAVDKDAVTIINHEKRITRIEKRFALK
ncbi:hypothetical protein C4568_01225 [Candidatus Parcubacteria bacterium]|nr:MAG: hypothetical protein C4568_01225 [Candidatus Parcubacteria bacterium]